MSGIVVQKYGGSSVADAEGIKRVARRIAATKEKGFEVCVVVSAMGATTDQLVARAAEITPAPPRRELDMLLTCGERASMALLSMAVSDLGYEAISFTGSQSGILTNDRHSGAQIIEVRPVRVQDELARGRVVIVAGFQGVSYKREITTLGRGGSDTTAVALAAALGAEYCEICSDVDGIYTADPRHVDAARLLHAIAHDEMLVLAGHGARVLHASAVEFARRSSIALYARATEGGGRGTRIDAVGDPNCAGAVGVTGQAELVRVRAVGSNAIAATLSLLGELEIQLLHSGSSTESGGRVSQDSMELWFALDDVPDWASMRERVTNVVGDGGHVSENLGSVTIVGAGIGSRPSALRDVRATATEVGVALQGASSSPLRVSVYCLGAEVPALVTALHRVFCSQPAGRT